MEALSPKSGSANHKPSAALSLSLGERAGVRASITDSAPSVALPLAFVLTGLAALCFGMAWIVARPAMLATYHYNHWVIAATHLFVLGWILTVVMGAVYQLVPVALETRLYSERLAWWQFAFHVVGFIGMVWMFRSSNMKHVGHFGSVLTFGVGLFVFNIVRTLRRAPNWNVTATAICAALFWICVAVAAGLSIAAAKCTYEGATAASAAAPFGGLLRGLRSLAGFVGHFDAISAMHAHAHMGAVGCFTMLIVGVSYKLIPMFTLSEIQSTRRAALSVALLNVGLAGSFVTILTRSPWKLAFAFVGVLALAVYGWELVAILRARKRVALDWGVKSFLTAIALFFPLSILAVVLSWPGLPLNTFTGELENAYGFLGLIGVVTFAIIGMLYKIIPFLVWFARYSPHIGRASVPALADLYSTRLQITGYWTYLVGLIVTSVGIITGNELAVRVGAGALALSVMTLAINVAKMVSHFFRRVENRKAKVQGSGFGDLLSPALSSKGGEGEDKSQLAVGYPLLVTPFGERDRLKPGLHA
jgi:hypothetical protein